MNIQSKKEVVKSVTGTVISLTLLESKMLRSILGHIGKPWLKETLEREDLEIAELDNYHEFSYMLYSELHDELEREGK